MLGYVDSAIGTLRALGAAETKFADAHPDVGFTCTLSQLEMDPLVAQLVKSRERNGYEFEIGGCRVEEDGKGPNPIYHVTARPLHKEQPAFCADESRVLKQDEGGSIAKCVEMGLPLGQ